MRIHRQKNTVSFFKVSYKVTCDNDQQLYKLIKAHKIPISDMVKQTDHFSIQLPAYWTSAFEKLCVSNGIDVQRLRDGDVVRAAKRLINRPGLIIGLLLISLVIIYLKNIVIRFDIINENEQIRQDIMHVLDEEGVGIGSYIPDMDLVVAERALKQRVKGISWAGITRKGNSLIIDVVEDIPAVKGSWSRFPSNLVAKENAVIDKVRVVDGQLKKTVGSGVCKGEIIVSGVVENKKSKWVDGKENVETSVRYARSMGTIEGSFERTVVFEQKFDDIIQQKTGEVYKQRYLHLFSANIPLFINEKIGNYYTSNDLSCLKLAGRELPLGIKTLTLEEYDFKPVRYTASEAEQLALKKADKYNLNFLKDYEIKGTKVSKKVTKDSVKVQVTYKLHGNICEEAAFFIKK